jgi:hypothetical protein
MGLSQSSYTGVEVPKLKAGDIILTRAKSNWFINFFLKFIQYGGGGDPARFTHVSCMIAPNMLIEAQMRVVKRDMLQVKRYMSKKAYRIMRKDDLTDEDAAGIVVRLSNELGNKYSLATIFWQFMDNLFRTNWFTGTLNRSNGIVCSSLIAKAWQDQIGLRFNGRDWFSVEPDDVDDETQKPGWTVMSEKVEGV